MSFSDVASKFKYCCQYSANPIPASHQDTVIQMVERLEENKDVGQIVHLLA